MPKLTDTTDNQSTTDLFTIEELQAKNNTPQSIYQGVCVAFGWRSGKMVSESEYGNAVKKFASTPIGKKVD